MRSPAEPPAGAAEGTPHPAHHCRRPPAARSSENRPGNEAANKDASNVPQNLKNHTETSAHFVIGNYLISIQLTHK